MLESLLCMIMIFFRTPSCLYSKSVFIFYPPVYPGSAFVFRGIAKYKPDCLFDTCNIFRKLFLAFDVALSLDHDPLCACGEPAPCMDSVLYPTADAPKQMFSRNLSTLILSTVVHLSLVAKNLLQISPIVSPFLPTARSELKSFSLGIVTISPPAMSSASLTISYGNLVTFCLQTFASSKSMM